MGLLNKKYYPQLQIVGHRGILWGSPGLRGGAGDTPANCTLGESLYRSKIGCQSVGDLRLAFPGYWVDIVGGNNETPIPNDLTLRAAIQQTTPSLAPRVSFNGDFAKTLKAGINLIISDPVGISAAANEILNIQVSVACASGEKWPGTQLSGTGSLQYASTLTDADSNVGSASWSGTSRTSGYGPAALALLGIPSKPFPSVVIIGDSIADGSGESAGDNNGNYGWICRGLWDVGADLRVIPYSRITKPGDSLNTFNSGNKGYRRLAIMQYCSHVIHELGTNDIASGANLATCQSRMQYLWRTSKQRGKKTYQTLITPKTTSTDSWATAANQTAASGFAPGGVRDQLNDWIITQVGQGLLDGYLDPNIYCEDQLNHGKWVTTGAAFYATPDGTHPSAVMHALMAPVSNDWAKALPSVL